MRALFVAFDIDFDQWWALTKTAIKVDLRSSSFIRAQRGAQARAALAVTMQVAFYSLMGVLVSGLVWFSRDLFLSSTVVVTYVMFMVGTAALLDHNAAIVSPDDYAILGYRPVTSRTYFAAKLANVLAYTAVITTLFAYLPIGSYFLRWGPAIGVASVVAVYGASFTVALTMVVAYASLMRVIGAARLKRALSYVQLVFSFVVYGGYFTMSRLISKAALASFTLPKTTWILLVPPTWFASYLEIAAGRVTPMELIPAGVSIGLFVFLATSLGGRLSLDYAERLGAIATLSRPVTSRPGRPARAAWFFRAGEARGVALLIRSQFKNDMKFRMGVLAILPLTLIYLFMGITSEGTVGDAFVQARGSSQGLRMVTLAMLMFPTMLARNLGRSDAYLASWIFFACPMDRASMIRAAKDVMVLGFLVPYMVVVGVVLAFFSPNVTHLVVHLVVVALLSHLLLQVVTFVDPELPFSKPLQKGRSSTRVFSLMFVIGIGAVILPIATPFLYQSPVSIAILMATLVGASLLAERLTRLRVEAQSARLEFEG